MLWRGALPRKAELKRGDVVVEYDGKKINDPFHFKLMVAETKPGRQVPIGIVRDGNLLTANVTIGELPVEQQAVSKVTIDNALKGVEVQDLTDEYRQKMNMGEKDKGVIVNNIDEDSPALGILNKGDVILEIDQKTVSNVKEYTKIISGVESNRNILGLIMRGGMRQYITVPAKSAK